MEKVSHFYLRSVFSRFLCFVIVSSIILLNTSIVSNASGVAGSSVSTTVTYTQAEEGLWRGNSYHDDELSYYDGVVWSDDNLHQDSWENNYWYLGKRATLFTSSPDFYGYRITFTRKTNTRTNYDQSYCSRAYWLVGSPTDLYNGQYASGNVGSSSFTAWVTTDNSVQTIHLAPYFKFTAYELFYADGDNDTSVFNYYDISNVFTVTYTGYKTKSEYDSAMNDIKTELEEQTGIQNDQLTELEEQTGIQNDQLSELEEQTTTQKNMFTKITDFFGSFFENLKNSVIGLFVPSKEDMKSLFDRMMDFFNEKFGFLAFPFDFFLSVVNLFLDNDAGTTEIVLPAFSIMGYQVWPYITFDLTNYDIIAELFGYVRLLNGVVISTGFINYLRSRYEKIMRR